MVQSSIFALSFIKFVKTSHRINEFLFGRNQSFMVYSMLFHYCQKLIRKAKAKYFDGLSIIEPYSDFSSKKPKSLSSS